MFVAWRDLRFAKGRFSLMGTVIVLITLLVGLLSGLMAGLSRQNVSAITSLPADRLAFRAPGGGQKLSYSDSTVTQAQWKEWSEAPGVESAEPLGITITRATVGDRSTGVSAFGVEPGSRLAPDSERITGSAVVLSTAAADDLGVGTGDALTLADRQLKVAAVAGDAHYSHTPVIWTSLDTWQKIAPPTGTAEGPTATVIALRVTSGADTAAIDRRAGTETVSTGDSLSAIGSYSSENGSLQLMRGFLFAISALVIGAFFTVWTIQRGGDVAVLKALGASDVDLLGDALGQAAVLLVGGTLIGTGIAVASGALMADYAVPFLLTPATVLIPAAVIVLLGVLGAAVSVRRITSVDPLTALGSAR
ncbi:ABC transporter permease [Streptomyces seoulensis]|uniref:FtsX-like permease family protein n=1 Tax=Streptomyces seoulensis TaxID=73044 RepID=A0A4P6TU14_STRSO|nr:ABC transporter permease [Streptomyces seoulensis]QBJ90203.1 FtsX-like permease family protein [Streptomyces seoulensis]